MGAIFYTEPFLAFDLDVFAVVPQHCSGGVSAPKSAEWAGIGRRYKGRATHT